MMRSENKPTSGFVTRGANNSNLPFALAVADFTTVGTSLQGYITQEAVLTEWPQQTPQAIDLYDRLDKTFGPPTFHRQRYEKVDWEWEIRFDDGTVATIYNYKDGPNYTGEDIGPADIQVWHIGGRSVQAIHLIVAAMFAAHSLGGMYTSIPNMQKGGE